MKRRLWRNVRIYTIHDVVEHIILSDKPGKFTVKEVEASDICDYKQWWKDYYKKIPVSIECEHKSRKERVFFSTSVQFHFIFEKDQKGYVTGYTTINGLNVHTFQIALQQHRVIQPAQKKAYPAGKVPIKSSKMSDFVKLKDFVPEEKTELYNDTSILNWSVTIAVLRQDDD
ncbi:hypothetical protein ANN_09426 [Periplaneta americana]|uniref:Uncharacterized protein n=1 Tax=Periplaneta americana TaxID=6978 RepID=A0ABQ8TLL9_PERAM|nr:hypothetical protein ANN_09426 [Periplaneta americana]